MITSSILNDWLQEPASLSSADIPSLDILAKEHPYFSPATLLSQYQQHGNSRNLKLESLFGYNPVIFHYWDTKEKWTEVQAEVKPKLSGMKKWLDFTEDTLEYEKEKVETDYFKSQGIQVGEDIPTVQTSASTVTEARSLLVVMSFAEWLLFIQNRTQKEQEEEDEKRALKALWQKQKMAEAIEEENEEIPANVFEMAVNSISREDGIVSESMAKVYEKQGKISEAINIYKKLSLNNPEKSTYFADKIENLEKEI